MHKLTARCRQIGRLRMNPTEKADQKKLLRFYLQYWRVWKQIFLIIRGFIGLKHVIIFILNERKLLKC